MALSLDERGLLVPGIHEATLDEVHIGCFQRTNLRLKLMAELRGYVAELGTMKKYESLTVVREQTTRVEEVIIGLHRQLWDTNRRNYYLYADGAIEMLLKLRAEMDEFLWISTWKAESDDPLNGAVGQQSPAEPAKS